VGFGAELGGTNGGGLGSRVVRADTLLDLQGYANTSETMVIQLTSMIEVGADTQQVRIQFDNKTIEGIVPGAGLHGGGLNLTDRNNIIIRNLTISEPVATDAISLRNSKRIWIDHCDLASKMTVAKGTYDGLIDIAHASDWITISWNVLHDHYLTSLVGNMLSSETEDTGHLKVTYHHNWFRNVQSYNPRVRFGTVHVFNNLYENVADNAVASQVNALLLVEGNVFRNVPRPILTHYEDMVDGFVNARGNVFDPVANAPLPGSLQVTDWTPVYTNGYDLDSTDVVPDLVTTCAGPKIP
jgi:pectate lyase